MRTAVILELKAMTTITMKRYMWWVDGRICKSVVVVVVVVVVGWLVTHFSSSFLLYASQVRRGRTGGARKQARGNGKKDTKERKSIVSIIAEVWNFFVF